MIRVTTLGSLSVELDGREVAAVPRQPLRAALLVYLALERQATRERIMAVLWPERPESRARHALSQALHDVRAMLGPDAIESRGELLGVGDRVEVDALLFLEAATRGQAEEALDRYRGAFLDGWHLADSREFEGWVDRQRARLSGRLGEIARRAALEHLSREDRDRAVAAARRWAELCPREKEAQHFLSETLRRCDRAGAAVSVLEEYVRVLTADDLDPAPDTVALLERLRAGMPVVAPPPTRVVARILVLPFTNRGPEAKAYFAEGITDELTSRLAQIPCLGVIARTTAASLPGSSIGEIRRRLHVDYVLAGTVRWDGERPGHGSVRITSELFRAEDEQCVWTGANDVAVEDVISAQNRVAQAVTAAIDARLRPTGGETSLRSPGSALAYDLYLQGRHYWNRRNPEGMRRAIELFESAAREAPDYAPAHAGLADTYMLVPTFGFDPPGQWYARARIAAARALELDDMLADAHAAVGFVAAMYEWDWPKAERHLQHATELAPSFAPAWVRLAYVLSCTGRPEAAGTAMDRGYALDPLSVATNFEAGFHGWQLRDRSRALLLLARARELDPSFPVAGFMIGAIHLHAGDAAAARECWARMGADGAPFLEVLASFDRPKDAVRRIERWAISGPGPAQWYAVAALLTILGAWQRALDWLERHHRNVRGPDDPIPTMGPNLAYIATDPLFDALRSEPRFRLLLGRMNLTFDAGAHPAAASARRASATG